MDYIHILPLNDIREHTQEIWCACHPALERIDEDQTLVIHNAWDFREILEALADGEIVDTLNGAL